MAFLIAAFSSRIRQRTPRLPGVEDELKLAVQRTSTAIAVLATAGISGLFVGAAPAFAVPNPCGTGTLISGNICEQTFTSTTATNFTPPAQTTKLEALLVGGGGSGTVRVASAPATTGYALGGGGGQVKIVDFTASAGSATPLVVTVGNGGTFADGGATTVTGGPGASASGGAAATDTTGGGSGTNTGASISDSGTPVTFYGGGAGAGPTGSTTTIDGGAGATVSTSFSSDTLFGSDPACYGGGGAALESAVVGTPGCGGNAPSSDPAAISYPAINANTGGGGAASLTVGDGGDGSSGVVVFRWFASYELTFAADGHGTAPASQTVVLGSAPTRPANPTASGFVFGGWFTDPGLTTPVDFSAPLTASTTFFAKWDPALPETGGGPNEAELPVAVGALAVGAVLVSTALYRRKRKATS
jgi:uncharacterized repeat protein (TIGR02543 family)